VKLRWRGGRETVPRTGPAPDPHDDLADEAGADDLEDPAGQADDVRPTGGPVLLSLTTREQIEQAAAAEAAPKMVRVRPGRGAFGGTAGGGGCANPHR
jgi:hypothetical protein